MTQSSSNRDVRDGAGSRVADYFNKLYIRAGAGNAAAQWEVGVNFFESNRAFPRNQRTAVGWFKRAIDTGYVPAMNNLAYALLTGSGTRRNVAKAIQLYKVAIAAGDVAAICNLGKCYVSGLGVRRDVRRGIDLLRDAASKKYYFAAVELADIYESGIRTRQNTRLSVAWLRLAARLSEEADDANVARRLALAYETGAGVSKSSTTAFKWMTRAAADGDLDACRDLAWYYQQGIGTRRDDAAAIRLYKKLRDKSSLFNIAVLYWERDARRTALSWFRKAASMGHARSVQFLRTRSIDLLLEQTEPS